LGFANDHFGDFNEERRIGNGEIGEENFGHLEVLGVKVVEKKEFFGKSVIWYERLHCDFLKEILVKKRIKLRAFGYLIEIFSH